MKLRYKQTKMGVILEDWKIVAIQEQTKAGVGGRCKELNPRGRCCHPDIKELLEIYGERK